MALLGDIQSALLDDAISVGNTLLKLRFLAAKLDVVVLEDWIQHELEGYPEAVAVPEYRRAKISYTGTFADIAKQINNVSVPTHIIQKYAGSHWVDYEIRSGLPLIDHQMKRSSEGTDFGIDASNLKLLLQDKIYEGMAIVEIVGRIDQGAFVQVQHSVRTKTLDFSLKLEKEVPTAADIIIGAPAAQVSPEDKQNVEHLTQQIFYGNVTQIQAGNSSTLSISVVPGDVASLASELEAKGIVASDARELAQIAGSSGIEHSDAAVEEKATSWVNEKFASGAAAVWGVGKGVAQKLITEALLKYYGLK